MELNLFEKYDDGSFPIFKVLIGMVIFSWIFHALSFDNTVLKNVDMEPFSEPVQEEIIDGKPFKHKVSGGVATVTPLANYKIYGRVYDRHYRPPKLQVAAMYPYDVSIGFGDFKYKEVYNAISVKMAGTVSYASYSGKAYEKHLSKYFKDKSFNHCFTNNHLCPANSNVRRGLSQLRKKDIVYIEGYLVKFHLVKNNGRVESGTSSTARNDNEPKWRGNNGNGTCEQIYVTRVVSRHGDYR